MEKLKLEHLAPYLPYGLKYIDKDTKEVKTMRSLHDEINYVDFGWGNAHDFKEFNPILRPLSDLTKEIEHNGERFVPYQVLEAKFNIEDLNTDLEYLVKREDDGNVFISLVDQNNILKKLYNWHFDLHGLIEEGLAINMNEI